eukprot:COSAG04_NODE_677_length_11242_cov_6.702324_3_plen_124_part_00
MRVGAVGARHSAGHHHHHHHHHHEARSAERVVPSGSGSGSERLSAAESARLASLESELAGLKLGELRKRANAVGVEPAALEQQIDDADDPKAAVVQLILAASVSGGATAVDANMLASMFAETR